MELLKTHFEPKKVIIAERFRFYKRQQREGETIAVYLSELRRLAKHCDFRESLPIALRDQLVCGLRSEAIQQKFLAEADLPLDTALSKAQAMAAATVEAKALHGDMRRHVPAMQSEDTFAVRQDGRGVPKQISSASKDACYRCGEQGHA